MALSFISVFEFENGSYMHNKLLINTVIDLVVWILLFLDFLQHPFPAEISALWKGDAHIFVDN